MQYRENLGYVYPERSDEHMIKVKHLRDLNLDENYPYYDKSKWGKFKRFIMDVLLYIIVFPLLLLTHGLKIHGRKKMKQYKKEFKNGAITISNHVFMWDYICVLKAIRPIRQRLLAWKTNFEGPNGPLIRNVGGMPIPTGNIRAMVKYAKAIDEVLINKEWLHVYPEGSMWFFYPDIRPLKPAVFKYAIKHNKPVIPLTFTFRKRKGITKLFTKAPFVDLHVGDPIFPDNSLPVKEAIDKMHKDAYHIMQTMCGINPGDPTYNEDQNINNYKKTM